MKVKEESEKVGLKVSIQKTKMVASSPITPWQIDGETVETVSDFILGLQNHCRWWLQPWNKKTLAPWKKSYKKPRQHIEKQRCYLTNRGPSSQSYGSSNSHLWMWELDHKESWVPKNWCFLTLVLEKTLESPLDYKEIQVVQKEISPGCSLEGLMLKLKLQYFWLPNAKSWLIGKDPDAGKVWGQEEKRMTEDEMVGWHHRLDGHRFGWTLGVGKGQGTMACCGSWGRKESDTTEWLNWTELNFSCQDTRD